jgi:hypothetical protein
MTYFDTFKLNEYMVDTPDIIFFKTVEQFDPHECLKPGLFSKFTALTGG